MTVFHIVCVCVCVCVCVVWGGEVGREEPEWGLQTWGSLLPSSEGDAVPFFLKPDVGRAAR